MKVLACRDVGLDCGYIIEGNTQAEIVKNAKQHLWQIHAIEPHGITSERKTKITENIWLVFRNSSKQKMRCISF